MSLNWNEYFMGIALLAAKRSKDPVCKVGCCIVDDYKHIVGTGYNGFPNGCEDGFFPWGKDGDDMLNDKRTYVVHAELNAILNATKTLHDCTLYVSLFPCNECAKAIIQSGIKKVVYLHDWNNVAAVASATMLDNAGIEVIHLDVDLDIVAYIGDIEI